MGKPLQNPPYIHRILKPPYFRVWKDTEIIEESSVFPGEQCQALPCDPSQELPCNYQFQCLISSKTQLRLPEFPLCSNSGLKLSAESKATRQPPLRNQEFLLLNPQLQAGSSDPQTPNLKITKKRLIKFMGWEIQAALEINLVNIHTYSLHILPGL